MFYVYILQSLSNPSKKYVGYSTDVKKRFNSHNAGQSIYTKPFRPWKLIYYCAFEDIQKAKDFESYLKTSSGKAFMNKRLV